MPLSKTSDARVVADVGALDSSSSVLQTKLGHAHSVLSATHQTASETTPAAIQGPARAAWSDLLDDWRSQAVAHKAQGSQLADGLRAAAQTYQDTDSRNAQSLRLAPRSEAACFAASQPSASAGGPAHAEAAPNAAPSAADFVKTPYGDLGKWMIKPGGKITTDLAPNLNPIDVIVVDRSSATPEAATEKLRQKLKAAGFGTSPFHGAGESALINGKIYHQVPLTEAFSNGWFVAPNDHGRMFGPVPAPGGGYVWTGSFDHEHVNLLTVPPTHVTDSYEHSQQALLKGLVAKGAVDLGPTDMKNSQPKSSAYPEGTMDYNGKAVTVQI